MIRTKIRLGEHTKSNSGKNCNPEDPLGCNTNVQDIGVDKITVHPAYNLPHNHRNDIAVVKLKTRIFESGKTILISFFQAFSKFHLFN